MNDSLIIDTPCALFLDRDGVINVEKDNGYVTTYSEFEFYDGVLQALHILSSIFDTIIVVTNQRGVGRGLMSEKDLQNIHTHMLQQVRQAGGRIDAIYYCTALSDSDQNRKPNPGMAHMAQRDFPHIAKMKTIMVGNKLHDMEFGKNVGMHTVFIETTNPDTPNPHPLIDSRFDSLLSFATSIERHM